MIRPVSGPPSSGSRVLPRDVVELKALAERQPELAPAATLQVDLIEAVRRVQGRITTPWIETSTEALTARLAQRPAAARVLADRLRLERRAPAVRQVTDVLRRHEVIDAATAAALHSVGRSPTLPDVMRGWFEQQPAPGHRDARRSARLGGAPVPAAHRGSPAAARQPRRLEAPHLPGVRGRAGILGDHDERRSTAGLRPLPRALGASTRSPVRTAATTIARASSRWRRPTACIA